MCCKRFLGGIPQMGGSTRGPLRHTVDESEPGFGGTVPTGEALQAHRGGTQLSRRAIGPRSSLWGPRPLSFRGGVAGPSRGTTGSGPATRNGAPPEIGHRAKNHCPSSLLSRPHPIAGRRGCGGRPRGSGHGATRRRVLVSHPGPPLRERAQPRRPPILPDHSSPNARVPAESRPTHLLSTSSPLRRAARPNRRGASSLQTPPLPVGSSCGSLTSPAVV